MEKIKKINLQEWATKVSSEGAKDQAQLTADCDAHPLWILINNCLFKRHEGPSFDENQIYQMAEQFCFDEYSSRAAFKNNQRYVHVEALRPISEAIPRIYLDLLLATEDIEGLPRRYYVSLYPRVQEGVRKMGKPETGFQILLMALGNEAHDKVARMIATLENIPLMKDKEMKKTYSVLVRAATCLKFRTTCANFDSFRSKLVQLVALSVKTKHPTEKDKEDFRNWKKRVIKELEIN